MVSDTLLTEIERQEKYLTELPEDFSFPLINVRHAVESQRRSGYRDTAAAGREIEDNAVEAGATRIDVVFDTEPGKKSVTAVAFIDNGSGMLSKMTARPSPGAAAPTSTTTSSSAGSASVSRTARSTRPAGLRCSAASRRPSP